MNPKLTKLVMLMMAATISLTAAAGNKLPDTPNQFSDSLQLIPAYVKAKRSIIKLYPNPTWNGTINISAAAGSEELHFFVFDLEGTLISQAVLKDKRFHTINNLKKGVYTYDVFRNDEGIEQGKIIVK